MIISASPVSGADDSSSGSIWQDAQITKLSNQCLFTSRVAWSNQNVDDVKVTVRDPDTYVENVFALNNNGSGETPWLRRDIITDLLCGMLTENQDIYRYVDCCAKLNCAIPTPTPTPIPTPTPSNFNLSVSPQRLALVLNQLLLFPMPLLT